MFLKEDDVRDALVRKFVDRLQIVGIVIPQSYGDDDLFGSQHAYFLSASSTTKKERVTLSMVILLFTAVQFSQGATATFSTNYENSTTLTGHFDFDPASTGSQLVILDGLTFDPGSTTLSFPESFNVWETAFEYNDAIGPSLEFSYLVEASSTEVVGQSYPTTLTEFYMEEIVSFGGSEIASYSGTTEVFSLRSLSRSQGILHR